MDHSSTSIQQKTIKKKNKKQKKKKKIHFLRSTGIINEAEDLSAVSVHDGPTVKSLLKMIASRKRELLYALNKSARIPDHKRNSCNE